MTDAALQFAEGERVLLRSHELITASQAFDLAIRMATENNDKDSLGRLARGLERIGDKERAESVNMVLKAGGTSRAVDPSLSEGKPETQIAVEAVQADIRSASVAASKAQLIEVEESLVDLPLSDTQRTVLTKEIASTSESIGSVPIPGNVVEQLDFLAGIQRPIEKVEEPQGSKFYMPAYEEGELNEAGFIEFARAQKNAGFKLNILNDPLSALNSPSRGNEIISKYTGAQGRSSIWQWVNSDGQYQDTNCGQAAMATILTYWKWSTFTPNTTPNTVRRIEMANLGPDVPAFNQDNQWKINFGGGGTSPWRMQSIADAARFNYYWGFGATKMEEHIRNKWPVVVLLDVANGKAGTPQTFNTDLGYHWVVVFAYDRKNYYCTNWAGGTCAVPKGTFKKGWASGVQTIFGIREGFMMAWPK